MASRKRRESFEMALARVIALDELPEKECRKCGEVRSPAAFSADSSGRFGLRSMCKTCSAEVVKARRATYKTRNVANDPYSDPAPKRCPDCERTLPRTAYRRNKTTPDGLQPLCRECQAQRAREQRENYKVRNAAKDPYADTAPKRCSDCKRSLPRTAYQRNLTTPDGLHHFCRECVAQRDRELKATRKARNTAKNPYANPTPKRCPGCEQMLPRTAYPRDMAAADGLYALCRECAVQRTREWQLKNPDKHREIQRTTNRRRRARKRQNGTVPYREEDVYAESDYLCVYCGAPAEEIDHFIPIARGGADAPWNVVATCIACNRGPDGKHARDPFEFFASRGAPFGRVVVEYEGGEVEELPFEALARTSASG